MLEIDLLSSKRGSVMAPAGCGKTQLIADTIKLAAIGKPVLVLTHTNAGRGALSERLDRAGVPKSAYRVFTIDSWAGKLIARFPLRSGCDLRILRHENPRADYPEIRLAAQRLLESGDVTDVLAATYSRILVDEYQDCTLPQHAIVSALACTLPTCVLGDPLQAIFGFRESTVDWLSDVCSVFPPLGTLSTPWRWRQAGSEGLGQWLLAIRQPLLDRQSIDLSAAPPEVKHVRLVGDANTAHLAQMAAARTKAPNKNGTVLVIGDSKNPQSQRKIASVVPGSSTVEALDLADLTDFARRFDPAHGDSTQHLLEYAGELMTNLGGAELNRRLGSLRSGKAKKPPNTLEAACLAYEALPSMLAALELLEKLEEETDVRVYRREVLYTLKAALHEAGSGACSLYEAVVRARERSRHLGRRVGRVAVGSTLLLKGLEADVCVVLAPDKMDARHLYVALTRGARQVVVCSSSTLITPALK